MTAFTSFFVRSECWSVIFWINSDFVIIFDMVFLSPGCSIRALYSNSEPRNLTQRRSAQFCCNLRACRLLLHIIDYSLMLSLRDRRPAQTLHQRTLLILDTAAPLI